MTSIVACGMYGSQCHVWATQPPLPPRFLSERTTRYNRTNDFAVLMCEHTTREETKAMKARMAFAATLLAGTASSAFAAPSCTPEALNALHVASVTVTEAAPVAATVGAPPYCDVKGTVVTQGQGAPNGSARFAMQLPDSWRQRLWRRSRIVARQGLCNGGDRHRTCRQWHRRLLGAHA
jgi:hypothetical protein